MREIAIRIRTFGLCAVFCLLTSAVKSEEACPVVDCGPRIDYGNGKLYSVEKSGATRREAFLISSRTYQGEDSRGFEGDIKVVLNYEVGGYEEKTMRFSLSCVNAAEENNVAFYENGSNTPMQVITVSDGTNPPKTAGKEALNLFWALCKNKFQKFK